MKIGKMHAYKNDISKKDPECHSHCKLETAERWKRYLLRT